MHVNAQRLLSQGFIPSWNQPESVDLLMQKLRLHYGDKFANSLLTMPGSDSYLPALIPEDSKWLAVVQSRVRASFAELIADIWTQLLVTKRDSKEKSIYFFWDGEVPKPTQATALAWLLTCESWPMPNHRGGQSLMFPPQPFMLPQSTPYGFTGAAPSGYAEGQTRIGGRKSLTGSLAESMHREDRERMNLAPDNAVIYRPSQAIATALGFHVARDFGRRYALSDKWAIRSHGRIYDQGMSSWELLESRYHLDALAVLRQNVMSSVLTQPGMPQSVDTLHAAPGMSIRNWSEYGLALTAGDPLLWTDNGDSVKLEHGATLAHVPGMSPRVWFGFSQIAPTFDPITQARKESAAEQWATAYLDHRGYAIASLFYPDSVDMERQQTQASASRAKRIERAGRLKKSTGSPNGGNFAAAFASIMKKEN